MKRRSNSQRKSSDQRITRSPRGASGRSPEVRKPQVKDVARWVIGIHACEETFKVRAKKIRELWLREDFASHQSLRELNDLAERIQIPIKKKSIGQLDSIGGGHQGVALAVVENPVVDKSEKPSEVVLLLDGIEDPNNLGSILRTAWLQAVLAIYIPDDRAVGLTPSVCKVASGGAEHVPVINGNLLQQISELKEQGFWIYGLSEKGKSRTWDLKLPQKVAWVVGREESGLRIPIERACDELVRIPQVASGSSYNAAIATAMALAETCRQLDRLPNTL